MTETIDVGHDVPRYSDPCSYCVHEAGFRRCAAFGADPIPMEIWDGPDDHTEPHPGDNGLRFEPKAGARRR